MAACEGKSATSRLFLTRKRVPQMAASHAEAKMQTLTLCSQEHGISLTTMKFCVAILLLLPAPSLAFVAPRHESQKAPQSSSARFVITDYQATRHYDELEKRYDDMNDGYAPPDGTFVSPDTSREWITARHTMDPRRVPNVVRNYEGRNRFGSNAHASLADRYERNIEEDMEYEELQMELYEREMFERNFRREQEFDLRHDERDFDHHRISPSPPHDVTMEVLLAMDLHFVVPAHLNSRILDDLTPRERLMHPQVFVMEGNLLRAKQLPENVYFVKLLANDLEEYMDRFLY